MADGHAAEPLLPAAEDAERFALQTRACIVRLNAFDPAGGKLLCRQAVEQEADIDDVVHMPPHVDIRRADEVRVDKLVLRQLVVEAHGRLGRNGKSAGKPDCSKRRIFCSGPRMAHCVRPSATVCSPFVSR